MRFALWQGALIPYLETHLLRRGSLIVARSSWLGFLQVTHLWIARGSRHLSPETCTADGFVPEQRCCLVETVEQSKVKRLGLAICRPRRAQPMDLLRNRGAVSLRLLNRAKSNGWVSLWSCGWSRHGGVCRLTVETSALQALTTT